MNKIEKCARLMGIVYSEVIGGRLVLHDSNGFGHPINFDPLTNKSDLVDLMCAAGIDVEWSDDESMVVAYSKQLGCLEIPVAETCADHPDKQTALAHAVVDVACQIYDRKFGGE